MIKRTLAAVVVLGGLCGVGAFANTFITGVEDNPSDTDLLEGYGDFNDMIVQFGATGLTATTGGTWSNFLTAPINQSGASPTNPFWDNHSYDGTDDNIGFGIDGDAGTYTLPSHAPVTQYLTSSAAELGTSTDFYFTFGSSPVSSILLGAITPNSSNEWFGIYNEASTGEVQWIIENGVNVVGSSFTPDYSSFGLVFEETSNGDAFFSQNSLGAYVGGSYTTTGVPANRFALFQLPDATTPEPATMAMVGLGVLALGLIPKLRKRS